MFDIWLCRVYSRISLHAVSIDMHVHVGVLSVCTQLNCSYTCVSLQFEVLLCCRLLSCLYVALFSQPCTEYVFFEI